MISQKKQSKRKSQNEKKATACGYALCTIKLCDKSFRIAYTFSFFSLGSEDVLFRTVVSTVPRVWCDGPMGLTGRWTNHNQENRTSTPELLTARQIGQALTAPPPSHTLQRTRCRYGNAITVAGFRRQILQLGPIDSILSGSTKTDSPSPHIVLRFAAVRWLAMTFWIWACNEETSASRVNARNCHVRASSVSWDARASSSAWRRVAFSSSTSCSLTLRLTNSSSAYNSSTYCLCLFDANLRRSSSLCKARQKVKLIKPKKKHFRSSYWDQTNTWVWRNMSKSFLRRLNSPGSIEKVESSCSWSWDERRGPVKAIACGGGGFIGAVAADENWMKSTEETSLGRWGCNEQSLSSCPYVTAK